MRCGGPEPDGDTQERTAFERFTDAEQALHAAALAYAEAYEHRNDPA